MTKEIWIINPYGPIPTENWRDYCFSILGKTLASDNFSVIWWTSSFSHHFKTQRTKEFSTLEISDNFNINLIPTPGYKSNISLGRIWRDLVFGIKIHFYGKKLQRPDLIIYSESPLNFGIGGYSLAKYHKTPVIFHQMDLWPELIAESLPKSIQPIANFLFKPIYSNRKYIYNNLDGVIALAQPYLDAALKIAPSLNQKPHELIYNGIPVEEFRKPMRLPLNSIENLQKKEGEIWAIFAGSLGPSYDILNLIDASEKLKIQNKLIKIIIAGDGPYREKVENANQDQNKYNLHYIGKLLPEELIKIYSLCDIGFCAYKSNSNVEMPDKVYDYTAAGLAVINSLQGEVMRIIEDNRIGVQYLPNKENDLFEKILFITSNIENLKLMKKNSYNLGTTFDQKIQYTKIFNIIRQVLGKENYV